MAGGLAYEVLGPLVVSRDGVELALGSPRQRAVLGRLLLEPNVVVSRDRLIHDLWGDEPPTNAPSSLRSHLSHLRRVLGAEVVGSPRPGYIVRVAPEALDSARFEQLADDGRRRLDAGDAPAAASTLLAALDLWRGDLLADLAPLPFAHPGVSRLNERRHVAVEDWVDAELVLGNHELMAVELDAIVMEAPLRERRRAQLMLALYRSGRQAEALRVFQAARAHLDAELGIEPGPVLRGLEDAILMQKSSLEWEPPVPGVTASSEPLGRVVGRQQELEAVEGAVAAMTAGRGGVMLLSGEAGIGKTTLATEAARRAEAAGSRVVAARTLEGGGAPGLWVWSQVLRELVPDWDDGLLDDRAGTAQGSTSRLRQFDSERLRQFDSVTRILLAEAQSGPLVVVLDDLHWADAGSLLLLEYVAQAATTARLLIVGTFREVEARADASLADALASVARLASTTTLSLAGLSEPEVARYLALVSAEPPPAEVVAEVWRRTDGNPFFVSEMARVLQRGTSLDTVPAGVHAHLRHRLAQLSPPAQQMLAAGAVVGSTMTVPVVAALTGLEADVVLGALDEARHAGLIEPDAALGTWRFAHALVREALYDRLPATTRIDMHRRAADVLEARGDIDRAATLAHHLFRAAEAGGQSAERAVVQLGVAADEATARLAWEDAAGWHEKVIQVLSLLGAGADRRALALLELARARGRAGDVRRARVAAADAAEAARHAHDPIALGEAALVFGVSGVTTGDVDWPLVRVLQEALVALGDRDASLQARLLARTGMALYYAPEQGGGLALAARAVDVARETGDAETLGECLRAWHFTLRRPSALEQRLAVTDEMLAVAAATLDRELELAARHGRIADLFEVGDIAGADRELAAYARAARDLRQPMYLFQAHVWKAMRALLAGQLDEAEATMFEAFAMGQAVHSDAAAQYLGVQMATLYREKGRLAELIDAIRDFATQYEAAPAWRCALAYFLCELGSEEEARLELATLAAHDFNDLPDDVNWLPATALLSATCERLDEPRLAAILYERLLPYAARNVAVGGVAITSCYGAASHYLGYLALTMGQADVARSHFEDALERNRAWGARPWAAHSAYELAKLTDDKDLMAWAKAEATAMGMPVLLTKIDATG